MKKIALAVTMAVSIQAYASSNEKPFWHDRERGWFWHEVQPNEPENVDRENDPMLSAAPGQQEYVELSVEWLRENFQPIMDRAMNNPTDTNLASFAYAQRLLADIGSRFSSRMTEYMQTEVLLDEARRRPFTGLGLSQFHTEQRSSVRAAMQEVGVSVKGIWFFYSSNCSFCHRMVPVLNGFSQSYNIEVLLVSLDGGLLPGLEHFEVVYDTMGEVAQQFDVRITPTLFLVGKDENISLLAEGLQTIPELVDKTLIAARRSGYLSDELYAQTRYVREENVFHNQTGSLMADRARLEQDPEYLATMLRERLRQHQPMGTPLPVRQ